MRSDGSNVGVVTGAPVRVHANANFYLDNSSNLYGFANTTPATREVATFVVEAAIHLKRRLATHLSLRG